MFLSGYFEFEALDKYLRGAVQKALKCEELKRKTVVVHIDSSVGSTQV